jgi:hypothetical protein
MRLNRSEILLLAAIALLLAIGVFAPTVGQPAGFHAYAEQRALWGIPHALDVLSNLPFAIAGAIGLVTLRRVPPAALPAVQRHGARLFFVGLLVTAAGSSWYHLAPHDPGLAIDRLAMSVAFAGLLGLAAACGISERAGRVLMPAVLLCAIAAVLQWYVTGNVLPWVLVQGGGMLLVVCVAVFCAAAKPGLEVRWAWVLLAYLVAKLLEIGDQQVFHASGELLSGHTLKHVVAALAAWPVIAALSARRQRQNGAQPVVQAA